MTAAPSRGGARVLTADEMRAYLAQHVRVTETGCHVWAGSTRKGRMPDVQWNWKRYHVRRLMLELEGVTIHAGHVVYTTCGTPNCVLRSHIRAGTRNQANKTKARIGAYQTGTQRSLSVAFSKVGSAKIPITERFNVARMRAEGRVWREIAEHYGVHLSAPQKQLKTWERIFGPSAHWNAPMREAA